MVLLGVLCGLRKLNCTLRYSLLLCIQKTNLLSCQESLFLVWEKNKFSSGPIFRLTLMRCHGTMFLYYSMSCYIYCHCQRIMGPGVDQLTLQPPWAYCEISGGIGVRIRKERGKKWLSTSCGFFQMILTSRVGEGTNPSPPPNNHDLRIGHVFIKGFPWHIDSSNHNHRSEPREKWQQIFLCIPSFTLFALVACISITLIWLPLGKVSSNLVLTHFRNWIA